MPYRRLPLAGLALAVIVIGVPFSSFAAEQGQISETTSTGSVDVSLEVPPLVRISDLEDIDLGTFGGTALAGSDDVCVWSTTRAYTITASGTGTGFELTGAASGDTLAYAVEWADNAGETSGATMSSGTTLTGRTANATSPTCNGGNSPNATVIVEVSDTDLAAAPADTYTGTLTLVVAPE
jgi:hypothetical protein